MNTMHRPRSARSTPGRLRPCRIWLSLGLRAFLALLSICSGCAVEVSDEGRSTAAGQGPTEPMAEDEQLKFVGDTQALLSLATCNYSAAGKYCWNDGITNGVTNGLYHCPGGVGSPASLVQTCTYGCNVMPSGTNDVCNSPPPTPPTPITMTSANMEVFNNGNYDDQSRLLWDDAGTKYGGNRLSSTYNTSRYVSGVTYTRVNAYGDATGQCVSLVKSLSGRTGATSGWVKGGRAVDNCTAVPMGTAVATFSGTTYSGHTGFLCSCSETSIILCDQNYSSRTDGLVRRHTINRTNAGGVGDAGAYYVVLNSN